MCLNSQLTKEEQKVITDGKESLTCWKVVKVVKVVGSGLRRITPVFKNTLKTFNRKNIIRKEVQTATRTEVRALAPTIKAGTTRKLKPMTYTPYFHLYLRKEDAQRNAVRAFDEIAIECQVEVEDITTIGRESEGILQPTVVIAKKFEFVGNNHFFFHTDGDVAYFG